MKFAWALGVVFCGVSAAQAEIRPPTTVSLTVALPKEKGRVELHEFKFSTVATRWLPGLCGAYSFGAGSWSERVYHPRHREVALASLVDTVDPFFNLLGGIDVGLCNEEPGAVEMEFSLEERRKPIRLSLRFTRGDASETEGDLKVYCHDFDGAPYYICNELSEDRLGLRGIDVLSWKVGTAVDLRVDVEVVGKGS